MSKPNENDRWDLIIRKALVFDGKGGAPVEQDVAVSNGRIAARGADLSGAAADEFDARGLWLMPGLLDIHTHLDLEVEVNPGLGEVLRHGTTTAVVGNCSIGTAFGAQVKGGESAIVDCFARVENMPKRVLEKCAERMTWDNSADYLEHFKAIPLGPNIAPLIPHSMLRIQVMGLEDSISRDPTDGERSEMERLLEEAVEQGYVGMSTDSLTFHYLSNDPHKHKRIPTQFADAKELKSLLQILRREDRVWQMTPNNERRLQTLGRFFWTSGRLFGKALRVSALAALDFPPLPRGWRVLLMISGLLNSRLIKGKFHFQTLATCFRLWVDGVLAPVFEEIESTRQLIACELEDREARRRLLDDPSFCERFRKDFESLSRQRRPRRLSGPLASFVLDSNKMFVESAPVAAWNGLTISEIMRRVAKFQASTYGPDEFSADESAAYEKFPPNSEILGEFFLHVLREYDFEFRWWFDIANTRKHILKRLAFDKHTLPGFNDSGAHIRNMAFFDGNLSLLQLAQEESLERVALAVKRLTHDPAKFFALRAGGIEIGDVADITIVDPVALSKYDTMAGRQFVYNEHFESDMLVNRSPGVVSKVFVGGVEVWNGDELTDAVGQRTLGSALTYAGR